VSPADIEREIRRMGLEGVVAKRRDSKYRPGQRTEAWIKVKFGPRQEFVIAGFKPSGANFDSILVGYYKSRRLYFAGKVRAGFTPHLRAELFRRIANQPAHSCPFVNLPNSTGKGHWGEGITESDMSALRWVKPVHVGAIVPLDKDRTLVHAGHGAAHAFPCRCSSMSRWFNDLPDDEHLAVPSSSNPTSQDARSRT